MGCTRVGSRHSPGAAAKRVVQDMLSAVLLVDATDTAPEAETEATEEEAEEKNRLGAAEEAALTLEKPLSLPRLPTDDCSLVAAATGSSWTAESTASGEQSENDDDIACNCDGFSEEREDDFIYEDDDFDEQTDAAEA